MTDADAVVIGYKAEVALYDAKTGKQRWAKPTKGNDLESLHHVLLMQDRVYGVMGFQGNSYVVVLERKGGKQIGYLGAGS